MNGPPGVRPPTEDEAARMAIIIGVILAIAMLGLQWLRLSH